MNRKIFNILFVSFIIGCLVMGLLGSVARAAEDPERGKRAYEQSWVRTPYGYTYFGHQYTSEYDLMTGNIFPEMTVQYSVSNPMAMFNPFSALGTSEAYSEGSAVGGLFSGPIARFPTSPMASYIGYAGAPRYETYQSQSPLFGSTNYAFNFPGLGGGGFLFNPFSYGGWGGGGYGGFGYPSGGWGGYTGYGVGGYSGSYPQRIY